MEAEDARERRTQEARSARTRGRLIEAAIRCLHQLGYSATTVGRVADEAGVSRGALAHQFPAKADLMAAVLSAVYADEAVLYRREIMALPPREAFRQLPRISWKVLQRPSAIAVIEIMLASRSEPELAGRLRAIQLDIDRMAREGIAELMAAAGVAARPDEPAVHRLIVAAIRGLAVEALFRGAPVEAAASVDVLAGLMVHIHPELAGDG